MRLVQVSTNYKDEDDGTNLVLANKVRRDGRKGSERVQNDEEESVFMIGEERLESYLVLQVRQAWSLSLSMS